MPKRKREREGEPRRYTFKLYPSREQEEELIRHCRMCGDLWNALLQRQEDTYRRHGQGRSSKGYLTFFDMTAEITQLRHECPEWAELSVWTAHRGADALDKAFQAFFRRAKQGAGAQSGYPRYRGRHLHTWLPHRFKSGAKMLPVKRDTARQLDWSVTLKGIPGSMLAKGRFPGAPAEWTDMDVRFHSDAWWMSVAVDMPTRRHKARAEDATLTVEFDLVDCFAVVNGRSVMPWQVGTAGIGLNADADEIECLQANLSGQARGSDEYHEIKRLLGRATARQARRRREALHEWTTEIVRSASSLTVIRPLEEIKEVTASAKGNERSWGAAVETKAMANRSILAMAPAMAVQMLAYKAKEAGIPYIEQKAVTTADVVVADHASVSGEIKSTRRARKLAKGESNDRYR